MPPRSPSREPLHGGGGLPPNEVATTVASGHLREAPWSAAVAEGQIGRFVALDQDAESLAVVERELSHAGIEAVNESVGSLLKGRVTFEDQDRVYAAGLFDYLDDATATVLMGRLFSMLRSGRRLLVANFTPNHQVAGYMACMMDWRLVQRDERGLHALATHLDSPLRRSFTDEEGNICYLVVERV